MPDVTETGVLQGKPRIASHQRELGGVREGYYPESQREHGPADIRISTISRQELGENHVCCLSHSVGRTFLMVSPGNWYGPLCSSSLLNLSLLKHLPKLRNAAFPVIRFIPLCLISKEVCHCCSIFSWNLLNCLQHIFGVDASGTTISKRSV